MADEKDEAQEPDMEEACFQIISTVGCAKSDFVDAIQKAKAGDFDAANALIEEGKKTYLEGHQVHMGLLQEDAQKIGIYRLVRLLSAGREQFPDHTAAAADPAGLALRLPQGQAIEQRDFFQQR